MDQGGDPPPPQDDEREEEHGDGADQRANGERRRNKRLTKKRRVCDEDEDVNEAALKQVFKKAKVNEFNGLNETGEDLEAWLEELEDYFAFKKFSEVGKAKIAILHLRNIAKLWWKAYMKQRTEEGEVTWREFKLQAEKQYCSPHYVMDKKMKFYKVEQHSENSKSLTVLE